MSSSVRIFPSRRSIKSSSFRSLCTQASPKIVVSKSFTYSLSITPTFTDILQKTISTLLDTHYEHRLTPTTMFKPSSTSQAFAQASQSAVCACGQASAGRHLNATSQCLYDIQEFSAICFCNALPSLVSLPVFPSPVPTCPIKDSARSALNNSSVGSEGNIAHTWFPLFLFVVGVLLLLVILFGILALLLKYWLEEGLATVGNAHDIQRTVTPRRHTQRTESWEDELRSRIDHLQSSNDNLGASFAHLTEYNNQVEAWLDDLDQENRDLWRRNDDLGQENVNWRATWKALRSGNADAEASLHRLQDLHAQVVLENKELERDIVFVQAISTDNARSAVLYKNALNGAESRIALLEDQLEEHDDLAERRDKLTHEAIDDALALADDLHAQITAKEAEMASLATASSAQAAALSDREIEVVALRVEVSLQESALVRYIHSIAARDKEIRTLNDTIEFITAMANSWVNKLAWNEYTLAEAARYPLWETAGFEKPALGDEDFEDVVLSGEDSDVEIVASVTDA